MGPRRKRQRLSEDGAEVVTASADIEHPSVLDPTPNDEAIRKQNLSQRRTLFVRSLAPTVTTNDLTEHFSESFPIKHAVAVLDSSTNQCKGYGFVTFADAEDAQRALNELNSTELQGKKIKVEIADPRHREVDSEIPGRKKSIPSEAATKAKAEREKLRKEQQPPKLIIRNLPWTIRESDQLARLFMSYGKVKFADIPKTHTGQLKGFGFVTLRGRKNAERALEGVNGKEIDGRTLAVDWTVDKPTWETMQKNEQDEGTQEVSDKILEASDDDSTDGSDSDEEGSDLVEDEHIGNTDDETAFDSDDGGIEIRTGSTKSRLDANTLFIRNLPFTADDESLEEHFMQFGNIRYARVVLDRETERPKGTGFVCFIEEEEAINCLKGVPRTTLQQKTTNKKDGSTITVMHSVLENEDADPTGKYTMDGRVLHISQAVDRNEAARLTAEGAASRFSRDKDKRHLYLLSEGTIPRGSPLYEKLSPSEVTLREASAKQRQKLIQSNPSLHLSLTRLSVRNVPRSITSKDLKALARQAIVGFAEDVKGGKRQQLSKEELARGGEAMRVAEKLRKQKGKGLVKQAKIVFETNEGSKVAEGSGAGRSRGYGFIEYYTHRNALMGLRWLNGHAVDYRVKGELPKGKAAAKEAMEDRKKRLIVEFAIENANVVHRRSGRENKAHEQPKLNAQDKDQGAPGVSAGRNDVVTKEGARGKKRKRDASDAVTDTSGKELKNRVTRSQGTGAEVGGGGAKSVGGRVGVNKDKKVAQRSRIIMKKRAARRAKKAGKV